MATLCSPAMKKFLLLSLIALQPAYAITIQIDYTYDTTNFFNTQAKKDAIEGVARFYGNLLTDSLLRIDPAQNPGNTWTTNFFHPATGALVTLTNPVIPADTIIVYVGARDLGGSVRGQGGPGGLGGSGFTPWFNLIRGRGNPGAVYSNANAALRTDFAPWGGSIAFDIDTTWNFSLTQNLSGLEFVTVALHEMGHVLGVGTASSWDNKVSGLTFTGAASLRANGSTPAAQSGGDHYNGSLNSEAYGSFNTAHGSSRAVLMLPSVADDGSTIGVATDLDLAGLVDIGWEVTPPHALTATSLSPGGASFQWRSSSFFDYQVQRATTLPSFPGGSTQAPGTGGNLTWTDPTAPANRAFYRLKTVRVFDQPAAIPLPIPPPDEAPSTFYEPPQSVACSHGE